MDRREETAAQLFEIMRLSVDAHDLRVNESDLWTLSYDLLTRTSHGNFDFSELNHELARTFPGFPLTQQTGAPRQTLGAPRPGQTQSSRPPTAPSLPRTTQPTSGTTSYGFPTDPRTSASPYSQPRPLFNPRASPSPRVETAEDNSSARLQLLRAHHELLNWVSSSGPRSRPKQTDYSSFGREPAYSYQSQLKQLKGGHEQQQQPKWQTSSNQRAPSPFQNGTRQNDRLNFTQAIEEDPEMYFSQGYQKPNSAEMLSRARANLLDRQFQTFAAQSAQQQLPPQFYESQRARYENEGGEELDLQPMNIPPHVQQALINSFDRAQNISKPTSKLNSKLASAALRAKMNEREGMRTAGEYEGFGSDGEEASVLAMESQWAKLDQATREAILARLSVASSQHQQQEGMRPPIPQQRPIQDKMRGSLRSKHDMMVSSPPVLPQPSLGPQPIPISDRARALAKQKYDMSEREPPAAPSFQPPIANTSRDVPAPSDTVESSLEQPPPAMKRSVVSQGRDAMMSKFGQQPTVPSAESVPPSKRAPPAFDQARNSLAARAKSSTPPTVMPQPQQAFEENEQEGLIGDHDGDSMQQQSVYERAREPLRARVAQAQPQQQQQAMSKAKDALSSRVVGPGNAESSFEPPMQEELADSIDFRSSQQARPIMARAREEMLSRVKSGGGAQTQQQQQQPQIDAEPSEFTEQPQEIFYGDGVEQEEEEFVESSVDQSQPVFSEQQQPPKGRNQPIEQARQSLVARSMHNPPVETQPIDDEENFVDEAPQQTFADQTPSVHERAREALRSRASQPSQVVDSIEADAIGDLGQRPSAHDRAREAMLARFSTTDSINDSLAVDGGAQQRGPTPLDRGRESLRSRVARTEDVLQSTPTSNGARGPAVMNNARESLMYRMRDSIGDEIPEDLESPSVDQSFSMSQMARQSVQDRARESMMSRYDMRSSEQHDAEDDFVGQSYGGAAEVEQSLVGLDPMSRSREALRSRVMESGEQIATSQSQGVLGRSRDALLSRMSGDGAAVSQSFSALSRPPIDRARQSMLSRFAPSDSIDQQQQPLEESIGNEAAMSQARNSMLSRLRDSDMISAPGGAESMDDHQQLEMLERARQAVLSRLAASGTDESMTNFLATLEQGRETLKSQMKEMEESFDQRKPSTMDRARQSLLSRSQAPTESSEGPPVPPVPQQRKQDIAKQAVLSRMPAAHSRWEEGEESTLYSKKPLFSARNALSSKIRTSDESLDLSNASQIVPNMRAKQAIVSSMRQSGDAHQVTPSVARSAQQQARDSMLSQMSAGRYATRSSPVEDSYGGDDFYDDSELQDGASLDLSNFDLPSRQPPPRV